MEWEPNPASQNNGGLRRRNMPSHIDTQVSSSEMAPRKRSNPILSRKIVQQIDLFPKIEQDLTVRTSGGGFMTLIGYGMTFFIVLAELYVWSQTNGSLVESVVVDKSLGTKMRVDLNITFPSLHCNDVHIVLMDVAGDVQNDVEDTIHKKQLHLDGTPLETEEVAAEVNRAHKKELEKLEALDKSLKPDYCGPCYGAAEEEGECCNHCDDVLEKYAKRSWNQQGVKAIAEQCVREGRTMPKLMTGGEGCELSGHMIFNRVNGNFHIAMGEGVERNGQFIHTFIPDDTHNFNASHVINELHFGPIYEQLESTGNDGHAPLTGVKKFVTDEEGETGMFQYFIKIVPTTYKGKDVVKRIDPTYNFDNLEEEPRLETNRYFTTERFSPLMKDLDEEHYELGENEYGDDDDDDDQDDDNDVAIAGAKIGGKAGNSHSHHEHHRQMQAVLPGLFFIYQIYPFAIEITQERVPLTHLLIRIVSMIGGMFTIIGWLDSMIHSRKSKKRPY